MNDPWRKTQAGLVIAATVLWWILLASILYHVVN